MTNLLFAQTGNYKTAIDNFQVNYNAEKYEEIFNNFSSEMKQALPLEKTKEFLAGLKAQVGNVETKEFISFQQGTYAGYKTKFEKMVLAVNISLDAENQINGLLIQPFTEPKQTNQALNALNNYPKEIAEIIFEKAKNIPNNAQFAIAFIQNGKTNYYGIIRTNDSIKPIDNQSDIFEIGSITKVFTSTVLASLVEDEKIKLTDEINTFYPFTFKDKIVINFESLANHTSGLPRLPKNFKPTKENNPYKDYKQKDIDKYLKNWMKLNLKTYAYSNLGAGLLGYTLGLSQKTTFQELLKEKVFSKYKMKNTFVSSQNLGNKLIKGMDENGKTVSNWDFDVLFGCGGMLSTTEDLAKFAIAQFNPKNTELALTRKSTLDINENTKIGLGWHIIKSESGKELYWHNGGTGGYSSSMTVNVREKTAVIILSNVSNINENIDGLCLKLLSVADQK